MSAPVALFEIGPVWTRVLSLEGPNSYRALVEGLSASHKASRFIRQKSRRGWDGTVRFFERGKFLAGLTHRATHLLNAEGVEVRVQLAGELPALAVDPPPLLGDKQPRDYQLAGVRKMIELGRAAAELGTGGGKTFLGAQAIRLIGTPALWLCDAKQLATQTVDELGYYLGADKVGLWQAERRRTGSLVTVALVQTMHNVPMVDPIWGLWGQLYIDECHAATTARWATVAGRARGAWYRFGLTGTRWTRDPLKDMRLEGVTGPYIEIMSTAELIAEGWNAAPEVVMLQPEPESFPDWHDVRSAVCPDWEENPRKLLPLGGALYSEAYQRGVVENDRRNGLFCHVTAEHVRAGEKVLLLCNLIPHGDKLADALRRQLGGDVVWWIHGDAPDRERQLVEFRQRSGGGVLVASRVFDKGMNVPEIDALAIASGGESANLTKQRVGRGLRKRPGKDTVLVYDSLDGRVRDRRDYLWQHARARVSTYKQQGFKVSFREAGEMLLPLGGGAL